MMGGAVRKQWGGRGGSGGSGYDVRWQWCQRTAPGGGVVVMAGGKGESRKRKGAGGGGAPAAVAGEPGHGREESELVA